MRCFLALRGIFLHQLQETAPRLQVSAAKGIRYWHLAPHDFKRLLKYPLRAWAGPGTHVKVTAVHPISLHASFLEQGIAFALHGFLHRYICTYEVPEPAPSFLSTLFLMTLGEGFTSFSPTWKFDADDLCFAQPPEAPKAP